MGGFGGARVDVTAPGSKGDCAAACARAAAARLRDEAE